MKTRRFFSLSVAISIVAAISTLAFTLSLASADIIQEVWNQSVSLGSGGNTNHRGQTFTADSTVAQLGSIGFFYVGNFNEHLPDSQPTITLYEGLGYGGTVVNNSTIDPIPADSPNHWVDADFSGTTLTPGQLYTFQLNQPVEPVSGAYALYASSSVDIYPDGEHLSENGTGFTHAYFDLAFRVLGIPEPSTLLLGALVGLGLFVPRRIK
ncbi:MAG: hypothetical protein KDA57_00695 [Planctomycetales bacterium]|nr:hypothetical protein [Planctomycetales bacterium]